MSSIKQKSTVIPSAAPSATIRDVARNVGVSIATISRVFSGNAKVSEATSERVRKVAAEMGYWPNGAARSLITKRTHALGIMLPDLYGEFFSEVIRGADLAANISTSVEVGINRYQAAAFWRGLVRIGQ